MLKNLFIIPLFLLVSNSLKSTIHEILVWNGYMQFMPSNLTSVQLGDTIEWHPLDVPTMVHTVTSTNIPNDAIPFDQIWQAPADTFFQYIPAKIGLYEYVCTPHIPSGMRGRFNEIELDKYLLNSREYNKRILQMTIQRIISTI
ncbi:plastocyanin/azurin family copper-binding protein [Flavobacteriales bacterium]|nr:plastocyanin/azurin family copper-binding protein [Flavobacteriales bacterium]